MNVKLSMKASEVGSTKAGDMRLALFPDNMGMRHARFG